MLIRESDLVGNAAQEEEMKAVAPPQTQTQTQLPSSSLRVLVVDAFLDAGADLVLAKPLGMHSVQMLLTFITENEDIPELGSTLTYPSGNHRRLVEQNNKLFWSI
eukprot:gene24950-33445_t